MRRPRSDTDAAWSDRDSARPDARGDGEHRHTEHSHTEHSHTEHSHTPTANSDRRLLAIALGLISGFMIVEVVVGFLASSLALFADAGHMLTDAGAIALALLAMRLVARPASGSFTYGLARAEIVSAQANGLTLVLLAILFTAESIRRLITPADVDGGLMIAVALVGVAVNLVATLVLSKANRQSLNVEGSFQHILTDLYAFVGTAVAGLVVVVSGWERADPLASLLVAGLMARAGLGLVRESGRIFLEAAPRGAEPAAIERSLRSVAGVVDVHDLHVWSVRSGFPALSAHVLVAPSYNCHRIREELEVLLEQQFQLTHTTLQVDHRTDLIADSTIPTRGSRTAGPPRPDPPGAH